MRILLVSSSSGSRGGGEIFLLYLGAALKTAGHTVGLWASRHARMGELAQRFEAIGEVVRAEYRNTYDTWHRGLLVDRSPATLATLRASWLAWQPDVVHLNKQNLEDGLDLLEAAEALRVPHLCTIHITQSARFLRARFAGWRDGNARRALAAYRAPLVAVAPARATELRTFVGATADVRVVLNGVPPAAAPACDRATLRAAEGLRPNSLAIVDVGRLEAQKSPLRFLQHAARIRAIVPDAELRWIGSGRMAAEWDREVAARKLGATVRRIDWRDDVRGGLAAYDLMLHPAAYEGLSLALLEAMDAGVPCAVDPAVHAQLPAALQACSLAVNDATDWAGLLGDRAKLAALGEQARAVVRKDFSTAAMGRAYESLYTGLCRKR
jgi:glycosyltransferase involved in cell wall biosynthesis